MSQTVDTNVLVYAANQDDPGHQRASELLDHLIAGPALVSLLWPALFGFLRIATSQRILPSPLTHAQAMGNLGGLLALPHVQSVSEGPRFWASYATVTRNVQPRGNLVSDAHLVALMHEHGTSTIWTHDRDFRKFDGITVRDPFDARYADGFG